MSKSISYGLSSYSAVTTKNYLILFIFWPFLAFLLAIKNYWNEESRKVVYIFLIYYGLSFIIANESVDSFRYVLALKEHSLLPFSELFNIVGSLYTQNTIDIFAPIVSFLISRITTHHGILFAVWVAIFGFFYLKSINLLYSRFVYSPDMNSLIFMSFFVLIIPVTAISGVRMPLASWVFFYGAYHVILKRDSKFLLVTLSSILIHWSFITLNAILLIYYFAGNRNIIYMFLVIVSFILPNLMSPVFSSVAVFLGGPFQSRYESYSNETYILNIQEWYSHEASWFVGLSENMIFFFFIFLIIYIKIFSKDFMNERSEKNLFSFILLFLSFINFAQTIPTLGGRFRDIFYLFTTLYVFMYFLKVPSKNMNYLTIIGLFPMALYAMIKFRIGSETINAWIFTPGIGLPFMVPELSLANLLFN